MSNNQFIIPNINKQYKLGQKSNISNLSPNIRQIHPQPKKIQNNLFPKNNNNGSNIKVNKIRLKKENIIEGDQGTYQTSHQNRVGVHEDIVIVEIDQESD